MRERSPSATAQVVARGVLLTAMNPAFQHLLPESVAAITATLLQECSRKGALSTRLMSSAFYRRLLYIAERFTIPGIALHYVLRKRSIENAVRQGIDSGAMQVVVIGAGFDTLALRLGNEFPHVRFIEIDHPATQEVKRKVVEKKSCILSPPNFHFLSVDLTKRSLDVVLNNCSDFQPGTQTIFIAEGLTMYLTSDEVALLFKTLRANGSNGSRIIFTFMERDSEGKVNFPSATSFVNLWLKLKGEPFQWGIKREHVVEWLGQLDIVLNEIVDTDKLLQRYLPNIATQTTPPARGEFVCIAQW
ncbi:MAG: class I SAM-dependent methyltransferase [Ignavibacteriae bacterium]|nr:class I SAM-dependent methyltransferase [Ignavibacteriota bacterium]MCB9215972.1 class I SAM-dependent methyltransferase [Ignavibacteria bacterium]